MVLQNPGRKLRFGIGNNYIEWHQNVSRILPLIIGVAALATTLLLGSYLWRLVTRRKNKNQGETPAPSSNSHLEADSNIRPNTIRPFRKVTQEGIGSKKTKERAPLADFLSRADDKPNTALSSRDLQPYTDQKIIRPNTIITFRDFNRAPAASSPKVADYASTAYFDELDAEDDYEQVIAGAQFHAEDSTRTNPIYNSPEKFQSVQSWLARSPDIRHHSVTALEDADEVFAQHEADIFQMHQHKSSKSWKTLLFWKRSKKPDQFEFNPTGAGMVHSSCTTPMHHLFKSSRARATVTTPSFPSIAPNRKSMDPMPKRSKSGPLYYDGTPYTPNRTKLPFSSPLNPCSTPSGDGLYEPTYRPLTRLYSSSRTCPSPLYIP